MSNRPEKPVWELVGMDQMTYSKLPIKKKRMLMRRAGYPIPIRDVIHPVQRFTDWAVPAYLKQQAELKLSRRSFK